MGETKDKKPETVVQVAEMALPIRQAVWRDGHSNLYLWQGGGTFKDEGVSGDFGCCLATCAPYIHVKWTGADGSEQSSIFTLDMQDIIAAVLDVVRTGRAEERVAGAKNSAVPVRRAS